MNSSKVIRARVAPVVACVWALGLLSPVEVDAKLPAPNRYNSTPTSCLSSTGPDQVTCGPWTVPDDGSNPETRGQCVYWATEKRPDLSFYSNAWDWGLAAADAGYAVDNTPAVGDVAAFPRGYDGAGATTGHVAYVEAVNPDGSIVISETNAGFRNPDPDTEEVVNTEYIPASVVVGTNTYTGRLVSNLGHYPNDNQLYFIHQPPPTYPLALTSVRATTTIRGHAVAISLKVVGIRSVTAVATRRGRRSVRLASRQASTTSPIIMTARLAPGRWTVTITYTVLGGYRTRAPARWTITTK